LLKVIQNGGSDKRENPQHRVWITPNRNGWVPARLEDIPDLKKRAGRNGQYPGPDPTAAAKAK